MSLTFNAACELFAKILFANCNINIHNIKAVVEVLNSWEDTIGLDIKPFHEMQEVVDDGYVYYEALVNVIDNKQLVYNFGNKYSAFRKVFVVISGDAWGIHPDKGLAYLMLHENEGDMEYLGNQDAINEAIGER